MRETAEPPKLEPTETEPSQPQDGREDGPQATPPMSGDVPPRPSPDLPIAPILAPPVAPRRAVTPASLLLVSVVLSLVAGIALGALVMRHRMNSRKILIAVNGVTITDDQLFTRLRVAAGLATLHEMVQEELQVQFAQKKGLAPSDAQVEARYEKISRQPGFQEKLAASRMPLTTFKQRLRVQMVQEAVLSQGITVTPSEVLAFYRQQSDPRNPNARFYRPDAIGLDAIATPTRDQADRAFKELSSDTPFGVAASEYSVDPSKSNGGALAPLLRGRSPLSHTPALEAAVFGLKPGDRIGPVLYGKQWWIFQCVNRAPAVTIPFNQAQADCRDAALLLKGKRLNSKRVEAEFQSFERSANLQAFQQQYQPALQNVQ